MDSQLRQTNLGHVERSLAELSRVAEQMAKLPPNQPDRDLEASWKQQLDVLRAETQKVSEQLATSAVKAPGEAKTLADKIETMLQRSPRSAITMKELKSAAARLNLLQAKAAQDAQASIERQQTLQSRFDARVLQNRRDIRESLTAPD